MVLSCLSLLGIKLFDISFVSSKLFLVLSSRSDTELVKKGNPVRIEELKNIWQHVIGRNKLRSNDQTKSSNQSNNFHGAREDGQGATSAGSSDQKKPRVVWSIELHRKFVAAVNHLGIEKAVPKKSFTS